MSCIQLQAASSLFCCKELGLARNATSQANTQWQASPLTNEAPDDSGSGVAPRVQLQRGAGGAAGRSSQVPEALRLDLWEAGRGGTASAANRTAAARYCRQPDMMPAKTANQQQPLHQAHRCANADQQVGAGAT